MFNFEIHCQTTPLSRIPCLLSLSSHFLQPFECSTAASCCIPCCIPQPEIASSCELLFSTSGAAINDMHPGLRQQKSRKTCEQLMMMGTKPSSKLLWTKLVARTSHLVSSSVLGFPWEEWSRFNFDHACKGQGNDVPFNSTWGCWKKELKAPAFNFGVLRLFVFENAVTLRTSKHEPMLFHEHVFFGSTQKRIMQKSDLKTFQVSSYFFVQRTPAISRRIQIELRVYKIGLRLQYLWSRMQKKSIPRDIFSFPLIVTTQLFNRNVSIWCSSLHRH